MSNRGEGALVINRCKIVVGKKENACRREEGTTGQNTEKMEGVMKKGQPREAWGRGWSG